MTDSTNPQQLRQALVVDDSKIVRTVSRRIMEGLGFAVREAEDGQKAMDRCKELVPEVILLDWNMPVMNGLEFLQLFRQLKQYSSTRIIFCTTENELSKIQVAMESGADEYVMKPFDDDIIRAKLEQLGVL